MNRLFREEVFQARRESWLGPVRIAAPLSIWPIAIVGAVMIIGVIALIVFGRHTKTVRGSGELIPEAGLVLVKSPASAAGVVERRFVADGDHVRAGQDLLEISTDHDTRDYGQAAATINGLLSDQLHQIQSERDAVKRNCDSDRAQLVAHATSLDEQVRVMSAEYDLRQQQVTLDQDLLDRIQPLLDKGYVSRFQVADQSGQLARSKADVTELALKRVQMEQASRDIRTELAQQPDKCARLLIENATKLSDTKRQLVEGSIQWHIVVRASRDGIVSNSTYRVGQTIAPSEHLMDIWPDGEHLAAELWVPNGGVGAIRRGQRVALHLRAYPDNRYGKQWGVVTEVARSALQVADYQKLTGLPATGPMYRLVIALPGRWASANDSTASLLPGDPVEGDVEIGREALFPMFQRDASLQAEAGVLPPGHARMSPL